MPRRHLAGGVLSATGAQAATIGSATISSVIVARALGPGGNGTIALATSMTAIIAQVFALGLATGVTYVVSSGRWASRAALDVTQAAGAALACLGAAATLGLYAVAGDSVFGNLSGTVVAVAALSVPFALSWSLSSAVAVADDRYELYGACYLGQAVAMLIFVAALVGPFGATGAVVAIGISHAVTAVGALAIGRRGARAGGAGRAGNRAALTAALRFGMQTWVGELLALVAYRLDLFILNGYAPRSAVGLYSVAVTVTSLAWVLPGALQAVIVPRAAQVSAAESDSGGSEESTLLAVRGVRHVVLLLAPTAAVLAFLLLVVVPLLYGARFRETASLGLLLLPGALALALTKVLTGVVIGRGFPRYAMITTLIVTPITVVLYFVMIKAFAAHGAAIATTISYCGSLALSSFFFLRVTKLRPLALLPGREEVGAYAQATGALVQYLRAHVGRG